MNASEADGYAGRATAFAMKRDKLVRATLPSASSFEQLLARTREHFGVDRALALVPSPSDRLPKA